MTEAYCSIRSDGGPLGVSGGEESKALLLSSELDERVRVMSLSEEEAPPVSKLDGFSNGSLRETEGAALASTAHFR